eukprot:3106176-Pyramimonas_sp.AAC.1
MGGGCIRPPWHWQRPGAGRTTRQTNVANHTTPNLNVLRTCTPRSGRNPRRGKKRAAGGKLADAVM